MLYVKEKFKLYTCHQYALKMRTATPLEAQAYESGKYDNNKHEKGVHCLFIYPEANVLMVATYQPRKQMVLPKYLPETVICYEFPNRKDLSRQELRDLCKKHPNYGIRVDCGELFGMVNDTPVKVDNLGKWLFGLGGYKGQIIIDENRIVLNGKVPNEAVEMIREVLN